MKKSEEPRIINCEKCGDRGWYTEKIEVGKVWVYFCDCLAEKRLQDMLKRLREK
jgi:hypothetical protein